MSGTSYSDIDAELDRNADADPARDDRRVESSLQLACDLADAGA
jgi:hypothetical protein